MDNRRQPTILETMLYGINTINENIVTLSQDLQDLMRQMSGLMEVIYETPVVEGATEIKNECDTTENNYE